jgi:hypothetical protein
LFRPEQGPRRARRARKRVATWRDQLDAVWGEWGVIVREVAGFDPTRYDALASVPLREVLIAYEEILRRRVLAQYHHDQSLVSFAGTKDGKPIPVPPLLRHLMS